MSLNSSRRAPTSFHNHTDARSNDSHSVLSSHRIFDSPRSPASTAVSSWIDDVASGSPSPSPSQWVIPLPPVATNQPGHLHPPNIAPYMVVTSYPNAYPQTHIPPLTPYASPPGSDRGSVSSRRSMTPTHTRSSARDRVGRDGSSARSPRHLDTVLCQICLQQVTVCRCVGGEEARLRMQEAAHEVLNRGRSASENRPTQRSQEPQVALQAGIAEDGYPVGYGGPVAYAGSAFAMNSEQAIAAGGYAGGYYGSPMAMPTSQTWFDEERGSSVPFWGVHGG